MAQKIKEIEKKLIITKTYIHIDLLVLPATKQI